MTIINDIIIFLIVFLIVMWLQHNDDIKFQNREKRLSLYDKVKLPLLVSSIVLLLKNIDYKKCYNDMQSIFIIEQVTTTPQIENIEFPYPKTNCKSHIDNIFTEPPDF